MLLKYTNVTSSLRHTISNSNNKYASPHGFAHVSEWAIVFPYNVKKKLANFPLNRLRRHFANGFLTCDVTRGMTCDMTHVTCRIDHVM